METEIIIYKSQKRCRGPDIFTGEFYNRIEEELTPILYILLQKIKEGMLSTHFMSQVLP